MVYVGEQGVTDDAALHQWVQRAVDFVTTHPAPAKRRRRG
jgi:hypothetical protein